MTKKKNQVFEPLNKWILVEPESTEVHYGTTLISGDDINKKPQYGKVVAIGDDVDNVDVDDRIYFQKNGTVEIEDNGVQYILVNKLQFLGKWKKR